MSRRPARWLWALLLLLLPSAARADAGDWQLTAQPVLSLELQGAAAGQPGAQLQLAAERGLTDVLQLRLQGVGAWYADPAAGRGELGGGLVAQWDVLRWVPALALTAGVQWPGAALRLAAQVEVRAFVSPRLSLGLLVGLQRLQRRQQLLTGAQITASL